MMFVSSQWPRLQNAKLMASIFGPPGMRGFLPLAKYWGYFTSSDNSWYIVFVLAI